MKKVCGNKSCNNNRTRNGTQPQEQTRQVDNNAQTKHTDNIKTTQEEQRQETMGQVKETGETRLDTQAVQDTMMLWAKEAIITTVCRKQVRLS